VAKQEVIMQTKDKVRKPRAEGVMVKVEVLASRRGNLAVAINDLRVMGPDDSPWKVVYVGMAYKSDIRRALKGGRG
jgi:hypothetical protein